MRKIALCFFVFFMHMYVWQLFYCISKRAALECETFSWTWIHKAAFFVVVVLFRKNILRKFSEVQVKSDGSDKHCPYMHEQTIRLYVPVYILYVPKNPLHKQEATVNVVILHASCVCSLIAGKCIASGTYFI